MLSTSQVPVRAVCVADCALMMIADGEHAIILMRPFSLHVWRMRSPQCPLRMITDSLTHGRLQRYGRNLGELDRRPLGVTIYNSVEFNNESNTSLTADFGAGKRIDTPPLIVELSHEFINDMAEHSSLHVSFDDADMLPMPPRNTMILSPPMTTVPYTLAQRYEVDPNLKAERERWFAPHQSEVKKQSDAFDREIARIILKYIPKGKGEKMD